MVIKDLIDGFLRADPLDFVIWAQWYVKRGITCRDCIRTREIQSRTKPNCYTCGLPTAKLLRNSIFKETKKDENNQK